MRKLLTVVAPFAVLAATALSAAPAAAANVFLAQTDNWFVLALTNSCLAFNRPGVEYNASPWNSLTIHAPKDGLGFVFEVMFLPKSFEPGSPHSLTLRIEGRNDHKLDARATSDYALQSSEPAPDDLIKDLRTAKAMEAQASGLPIVLTFDTSRIDDVFGFLDTCRSVIRQN